MNKSTKLLIIELIRLKTTYSQEDFLEAIRAFNSEDDKFIADLLKKIQYDDDKKARIATHRVKPKIPASIDWLREENPSYYEKISKFYTELSYKKSTRNRYIIERSLEELGIKLPIKDENAIDIISKELARLPDVIGIKLIEKIKNNLRPTKNQYLDLANAIISGKKSDNGDN